MIHVIPVDDLMPHQEHECCLCNPKVEYEADNIPSPKIVIHNSFDGREFLEATN